MSLLDVIYNDTVTVFNRLPVEDGYIWIPHILSGVHLTTDRAVMVNTFGENSTDNAMLNVRYSGRSSSPSIGGLIYLDPKRYSKLNRNQAIDCITFSFGEEFDFIYDGEWDEGNSVGYVQDSYYSNFGGLFNYMNANYDNVFAISAYSKYDIIPHFTVTAK